MPDLNRQIEELLNSDYADPDELSEIANSLREAHRYDMLDKVTQLLVQKYPDNDDVLLLRAWYLTNIGCAYEEAANILRLIDCTDNVMYAILGATITLHTTHDADMADSIFEHFFTSHPEFRSDIALEAARLFISELYADSADKWITRYEGPEDYDYLMVLSEILMAKEDYAEAAEIYRKVLDTKPMDTDAWNRLTDAYISMRQYEDAVDAAEYSLAVDGNRRAEENIRMCTLCMNRQNNKTINNQKHKE